MIKDFELNFQADKKTLNNRVYTREALEKAFSEAVLDKIPVFMDAPPLNRPTPVSSLVGELDSYTITENGIVTVAVRMLRPPDDFWDSCRITTAGVGMINENNEIDHYELKSLFFVPK